MLAKTVPLAGALALFLWVAWFRSYVVERAEHLPVSKLRRVQLVVAVVATAAFLLYAAAAGIQVLLD